MGTPRMLSRRYLIWLALLAAGLCVWLWLNAPQEPCCPDGRCPLPPRAPSPDNGPRAPAGAKVGGSTFDDGTQLHCDMPPVLYMKNKGGSDGAGLCVFTSLSHSARWQNLPALENFRDWMTKYPGGGYPSKVEKMIGKLCKEKGVPVPDYIQVESGDLEVLKAACRSGRMPGVTYSFSPTGRYGGKRISHMVSLVHADDKHFVIADNNYPPTPASPAAYEWMSPDEFKKTYTGGRNGWACIFLSPPPPPAPRNLK